MTKDPTQAKLTSICKSITIIQKEIEGIKKGMEDVKEIKRVLKGDTYGTKGLVQSHKDLRIDFNNVKDDVKKAKTVGTVIAAILGFFGSLIAIFKS